MTKSIFIAFDESENSQRAIEFVGHNLPKESKVTLFTVILDTESMCAMQSPELTPYFKSQQKAFCSLEDKKKEVISAAMKKAKTDLIQNGFAEKDVVTKTINRQKGIARDIIEEVNQGDFDLVVLGKQGLSGVKEFFLGSITQKVIQKVKTASILLVD